MYKVKNYPVDNMVVNSPFGIRFHPIYKEWRWHNGIDIPKPIGTKLYAIADGKVVISKADNGGVNVGAGYYIVIDHGNYQSRYCHMRELSLSVGTKVKAGDVIGYSGSTGASTGPHLHFEIRLGIYNPSNFWAVDDKKKYLNATEPVKFLKENIMDLSWEEIIQISADKPELSINAIDTIVNISKLKSNIGDLEHLKYIPDLLVKVYKKGLENGGK